MRIKMKQLFGILFSLVLVLSLMPCKGMNAYAADYTEWSNSGVLPTEAGSYYLTTDITLDSTWCVPSGATNLRLNGHGIIYTGSNNASVITVGNGAELNLYDNDTTTKHYVMLDAKGRGTSVSDTTTNGAIEVTGGYITGGTISERYGGGVYVSDGGSFTMYGGTIIGNTALSGGGVGVAPDSSTAIFNMKGGTITSNTSLYYGGGVFNVGGTVNMENGVISNNNATDSDYGQGGGVSNIGTFNMSGGSIQGNKASYHGGVRHNGGTVNITGGTIEGNSATVACGGLYVYKTVNLSGNVKITNNTADGGASNLYVASGSKINTIGELGDTSSIGVLMVSPGTFTNGYSTYSGGTAPSSYFTSDNDGYIVTLTGEGEAQLVQGYTVTYKVVNGTWLDGTTADKTETVVSGAYPASVPTGMIAASGYTGGSWDTDPSTIAIAGNSTFTYTFSADSSSSGGSTGSGNGNSSGAFDGENTSGGTSGSSTGDGYVKDITGTAEANAENNTFEPKIVNSSELKTLLSLTDAEVAEGVNVWLDIQDIGSSVSKTDKTLVQNASDDYTVGMYLDINLFKKVGNNDATKVSETNGKIKASIVIPKKLRKSGRTFELIRVHNGKATTITGKYTKKTHIFTFETDKFSTYAIAYKDAASSTDTESSDSSSSTTTTTTASTGSTATTVTAPKTGDPTDIRVWYLILIASLGGLGFLGLSKKKEN